MHPRTTRALAATAALALTLGACDDVPTSPAAARIASAGQPARSTSASNVTLIPNTVKYRDNGGKPARGRSGTAELEALALLARDGTVTVESRARSIDPAVAETGEVSKLQVKVSADDGTTKYVRNFNGESSAEPLELRGLSRGDQVQLQANVRGLDGNRTDVVTVTEHVKVRPDLMIDMHMASRVPSNQRIPIHAIVSEMNGDVGASARCVLLVDGVVADWSHGVWVDAGDAVTCVFSHTFSPGTHRVRVEVTNVTPGDWDLGNNRSAVVQVEAVAEATEFTYYASARSSRSDYLWSTESWWTDSAWQRSGEAREQWSSTVEWESASAGGWGDRGFSGTISVSVSQASGGRILHADTWTEEASGEDCSVRYREGTTFHLCTYNFGNNGLTHFVYTREAGTVTYHSSAYLREWDHVTGEDVFYYHYTEAFEESVGRLRGVSDDYSFRVRVAAGDVVLTANSDFPLQLSEDAQNSSDCYDYEDPWSGSSNHWCQFTEQRFSGWSGADAGS
jgi:hypothetical protein